MSTVADSRHFLFQNFIINFSLKKYFSKKNLKKIFGKKIGVNQPPAMADLRQRFTKKHWRESATPWLIHAKCARHAQKSIADIEAFIEGV